MQVIKKIRFIYQKTQDIDQKMTVTDQKMQVINETNASYQPKKKNGCQLPNKATFEEYIMLYIYTYVCTYKCILTQ